MAASIQISCIFKREKRGLGGGGGGVVWRGGRGPISKYLLKLLYTAIGVYKFFNLAKEGGGIRVYSLHPWWLGKFNFGNLSHFSAARNFIDFMFVRGWYKSMLIKLL